MEILNIALGETTGEFEFIVPANNFGLRDTYYAHLHSQSEKIKGMKEKVKVVTLDELPVDLPILNRTTFINIKCLFLLNVM